MSWNINTPGDYINGPLTVAGSATITGDLTVATSALKVDSTTGRVAINTATFASAAIGVIQSSATRSAGFIFNNSAGTYGGTIGLDAAGSGGGSQNVAVLAVGTDLSLYSGNALQHKISNPGVFNWYDGVGGTRMTLNSTGLGIGATPSYKLDVQKTSDGTVGYFRRIGATINPALTVYCNETGNTVGFGTDYAGATSPSITFTTGGSERVRIDGSSSKVSISASTVTAADDRLVFSENMGSVNLGSQIVWNNSSFSTPYASIGVSNGAAGSNGTLIFSTCSSIFTNTNTERVRIKPTGQVRFFPLAADPAGAETGDVYYNSVSNKLKCYNGTIWNDLF
jgi:hypothetical protein